jgi:hypothetical protein
MNLEKEISIPWLSTKQPHTIYNLHSRGYVQQLMLQMSVFQSLPPVLNNLILDILLCCNSSVLIHLRFIFKHVVPLFHHHHGHQHREKPDTINID